MNYQDFLSHKLVNARSLGFDVAQSDIHPFLFDWQRDIVRWSLKKGRAALFEECGMGKTLQQLEWSRHVANHTHGKVLILAPLAVAHQTVREGQKIDLRVRYVRSQDEVNASTESVYIANYEMLEHFDNGQWQGLVLDESSILKAFTGKTKRALIQFAEPISYRLCNTATPAPNDHLEFGNHSEFLGIMDSNKMISRWFINDSMHAGDYRLKYHAEKDYWRWMTSWSVCLSKPSDLGEMYPDDGFVMPEPIFHNHIVQVDHTRAFEQGQLFLTDKPSATEMWREKRETLEQRCNLAREIVGDSRDYFILWCDTNAEADELKRLFPDALEVRGSDSIKEKERKLSAFSDGKVKQIITKPDIAGFGLNWQHCSNQIFVGVTYSFEKTYQALRRSWRFGQKHDVNAHLIYAETEGNIKKTLDEKRAKHQEMQRAMTEAQRENGLEGIIPSQRAKMFEYQPNKNMQIPSWLA